jgi:hypothetical protein
MKSLFAALALSFLTFNAFGATRYSGLTEYGDICSVYMNAEENAIGFHTNEYGFVFITTMEEVQTSIAANNVVTLEAGDILATSKLALTFENGVLKTAVYKQRNYVFPKTITCLGLYPVK